MEQQAMKLEAWNERFGTAEQCLDDEVARTAGRIASRVREMRSRPGF